MSVSPASASLQSVVDAQQKLLSEKDAEIASLRRQLEQLHSDHRQDAHQSTAAPVDAAASVEAELTAAQSS